MKLINLRLAIHDTWSIKNERKFNRGQLIFKKIEKPVRSVINRRLKLT